MYPMGIDCGADQHDCCNIYWCFWRTCDVRFKSALCLIQSEGFALPVFQGDWKEILLLVLPDLSRY